MEVDASMTSHIMFFTRIGEEVGLGASFDTGIKERQAVLRYYGNIVVARDDLQLALQVFGLGEERSLLVALRIALRRVHIAFAIHHLIPFPVDDWTTSNAHFEHVGIVGH